MDTTDVFLDRSWPNEGTKIGPVSNEFTDFEIYLFFGPRIPYFLQPFEITISLKTVLLLELERLYESFSYIQQVTTCPGIHPLCPSMRFRKSYTRGMIFHDTEIFEKTSALRVRSNFIARQASINRAFGAPAQHVSIENPPGGNRFV